MAFFYHKTSDIYDQHVREKPCVRILDRIASQWHRIVTFLATALAFGLVLYAFLSDQWVEVEGSLVYDYVFIGLYKVTMGLAGYHVTVPTDAYKYNAQGVEANKYYSSADVSGLFGLNLLYDFPSSTLGLLAWLQFLVLASVGIVLLTMTYMWLFHQSVETRTDLVAGLYLAASFVLTLVIVLVYPLSISQLYVPSEREMTVHMCGANAGPYNPGNCSLGIGYWVVVGSLVPLLVGCVASNKMTLSPYWLQKKAAVREAKKEEMNKGKV
ncbi:hypothetical protein SARC_16040 [Sphaeroforma arctica JP610]|uniref:Uncharacterized protein n=1 Tax=Sphaeroforma arctica JP610 TaxID=667725 RepID=A0A0L0F482_9EUKA|nr:hypothetical protein SARC_16040 [Sphaeroforma arctica JP610]KNC71419.1 hypothetical protein SARC_16040 [Sphaeroforma arctica JP610]|eukprot:XP_014145321.1 hypothetical protein SARC_16040 [Sphaeroforma arctica JP610]